MKQDNIKLENCYDAVDKCKKCGRKYGYDYPSTHMKSVCGKRIKIKEYKDNGLCPNCDPILNKIKNQKV